MSVSFPRSLFHHLEIVGRGDVSDSKQAVVMYGIVRPSKIIGETVGSSVCHGTFANG
jgi:hypothetical protein